jgi:tripartite-type tricarboxylate transporter receptor subunit TctC
MKSRLCSSITGVILASVHGMAQPGVSAAYPTKPIRLITASTPGSPPDSLARIIAEPLAAALGQRVLVENRPGGSGTIGMGAVAKAAPDGHTLGTISLGQMIAPSLVPQMSYDIARDLVPVTQLVWTANILVIRPSSPLTTVADFVALAKAKPGTLTYASAGNGTPSHLASELFKHHAGIEVQHVPYNGMAAGLAAVMGEQVDIAFAGTATALPLIKAGKLRALGTAGARRLPAFPDLPTIAELGFAGYQLNEWYGVVAPAGTPAEIIAKLASEMARVVALPETKARLAHLGLYQAENPGPEALGALIRAELPRWKQIVREAGIRAD